MNIEKKAVNSHQVEFVIRVEKSEAQTWLNQAASRLSYTREFKGFRPGKAPYEMVKREFGEEKILQEAADDIVNGTLADVLKKEPINPYGKIDISLLPSANENEAVAYKATVNLIPKVTLGAWQANKVKRKEVSIKDDELDKSLRELSTMASQEEPKPEGQGAEKGDKVVADLEVWVEGKLIEGGKASDFAVVLGENRMIPGFEDQLLGIKPGERREYNLSFPENYQPKHLSGKPADFKVEAKSVLVRKAAEIDDALAKKLGALDVEDLKAKLKENALLGKQQEEDDRLGNEVIKQLTAAATFGEFPPVMVNDTVEEMVHEFGHNLSHRGLSLDAFLKTSGKTIEEVRKEFEPKAIERIRASLALMQLAEDEKITIEPKQIEEELRRQEQAYATNPHALEDIRQPEYRRYVANNMLNRKVVEYLKQKLVEN